MRVPLRRAGVAVVAAALILVAVDVTFLHSADSARSAGLGSAGRGAGTGQAGLSGHPVDRAGASGPAPPAASGGHAGDAPARGTGSRVSVPPPVTLAGAAGLPSANVHPGYGSPEDVVEAFYQALLGGSPALACAYATQPCPSSVSGSITGRVSVVDAVSDGNEALVEVTGTVCRAATCVLLLDRVAMPIGSASFGASWTSLTSGVYGWAGSPLPCVRNPATGQWLVKLS
jgi:hypothetical protein